MLVDVVVIDATRSQFDRAADAPTIYELVEDAGRDWLEVFEDEFLAYYASAAVALVLQAHDCRRWTEAKVSLFDDSAILRRPRAALAAPVRRSHKRLRSIASVPVYRIPDDFEPSVSVGRALDSVSFGPYMVRFSFGSTVTVTVHRMLVHESPEGWTDEATVPLATSRLMKLVGHTVTEAAAPDSCRVRLVFDNGHVLTFVDDTPDQYESFHIETETKHWIV